MVTALLFLIFNFAGWWLALSRGPFWGLLVYANIYFNPPLPKINWWASYIPELRWSLLAFGMLALSMFIHRKKLSSHHLHSLKWMYLLVILTFALAYSKPFHPESAQWHAYMLITFSITAYAMLKIIENKEQFRLFIVSIICFAGFMSLKAYTEGERVNERLENVGTADSFGSNEFGLLLAAILPFVIPFLFHGNKYEKLVCYLSIPFIINAIILTNSRSALVALVFAFSYAFVFLADKKLKKYMLAASFLLVPSFIYLADDYFIDRMATVFAVSGGASGEDLNDVSSGRWEVWKYGLQMVDDAPYGLGPDGFKHIARFYMPEDELSFHPGMTYGVKAAHNSFLLILVEQGYIGLIIFVALCLHTLMLLNKGIRLIKKSGEMNSFLGFTLMALSISFLVTLMGGMFNSRVYYEFFWWQVVLSILGYCFAVKFTNEKNKKSTER